MIQTKIDCKIPSSQAAVSIKSDKGKTISDEPPPSSQFLCRVSGNRRLYTTKPVKRRD